MSETSIEKTNVAERRRLRIELEREGFAASPTDEPRLSMADTYEAHRRRWQLTRSGGGPRPSGWREPH